MRYTEVEKAVAFPISSELTIAHELVLLTFSTRDCRHGKASFQRKRNPSYRDA